MLEIRARLGRRTDAVGNRAPGNRAPGRPLDPPVADPRQMLPVRKRPKLQRGSTGPPMLPVPVPARAGLGRRGESRRRVPGRNGPGSVRSGGFGAGCTGQGAAELPRGAMPHLPVRLSEAGILPCRLPGKPRAPAHRQPASFGPRNAPYLGLPPPAWSAPVPGGSRGPGAAERGRARCGPHGAPGAVGAPRPRERGARSGSPQHHLLVTGPARGSRHPPAATPAPGGPEVAGPSSARAPGTHGCLLPGSRAPGKKKPGASTEGARSARALRSSGGKDEASPHASRSPAGSSAGA